MSVHQVDIPEIPHGHWDMAKGILENALIDRVRKYKIRQRLSVTKGGQVQLAFSIRGSFVHRRVVDRAENHCVMRAFDRMLAEGNPRSGKIGVLLLFDPARGGLRCLASFAVTDWSSGQGVLRGHRFVLFPSWKYGSGMVLFKDNSKKENVFKAHHITFDSNPDGTLNCHATSADRNIHYKLCQRMLEEDGNVILGEALVQNHRSLDQVGLLAKSIDPPCDPKKLIQLWEPSLRSSFTERHPVLIPPDIFNKEDRGIVMVQMRLGNRLPKPGKKHGIPMVCFSQSPQESISKSVQSREYYIRIYPDLILSLSLIRLDGMLKSDTIWAFEKGMSQTNRK
jgi:hypothetical protein